MLLNFNKMSAPTGKIGEIRASGGGAASDIRLQIKADILNSKITALAAKEVGAAGTAVRKVFSPNPENTKKYNELYQKYEKLYDAVKELSL